MLNIEEIAAQNGGQTEKLKFGPKQYQGRTIEEMREDVIARIEATIADLEAIDPHDDNEVFWSPMAKEVNSPEFSRHPRFSFRAAVRT